jgi:hypothetical protein
MTVKQAGNMTNEDKNVVVCNRTGIAEEVFRFVYSYNVSGQGQDTLMLLPIALLRAKRTIAVKVRFGLDG